MNNTNETCTVCGGAGELAVIRLATGNLALDAACALHRPPGAMAPADWAAHEQKECRVFPNASAMTRGELLFWLFSAAVSSSIMCPTAVRRSKMERGSCV